MEISLKSIDDERKIYEDKLNKRNINLKKIGKHLNANQKLIESLFEFYK